jgi:hypothetical protein
MRGIDPRVQAALLRFGKTAVVELLSKPNVQSTLRGFFRKVVTGSREKQYREIPEVDSIGDQIVGLLRKNSPGPYCIGIDGIAGSGKSTLGRSLAKKLDLPWRTLYSKEMKKPLDFEKGVIYENMRLFRAQPVDAFDALIYHDVPVDVARQRVIQRDRNASLADYLDFGKLKRIGDLAFEMADGESICIADSPVHCKCRPSDGYQMDENLDALLATKGLTTHGLNKEEKLFLYCYGKVKQGVVAYAKWNAYNREIAKSIASALSRARRRY